MKVLIVGLAITVLYAGFLVFQADHNRFIIKQEELKALANECSGAAALYYEKTAYKDGYKVFDISEGNKAIGFLIRENLKLDEEFNPLEGAYWVDTIDYYVHYYDDSGLMSAYHRDSLTETGSFSYGDLYVDPVEDYMKVISEPTVIVTIIAGRPRYRVTFFEAFEITAARSSAYEYVSRD